MQPEKKRGGIGDFLSAQKYKRISLIMYKRLKFALLCLCVCAGVHAQVIEGVLTDAADGEPLVGATVKIAGTHKGTVTDFNGHYRLEGVVGLNQMEFSYVGYSSESRGVNVQAGETKHVSLALSATSDMLDEVVVSAGRFEQNLNEVTVSMELLKAGDVKKQSPGDVTAALKTLSGVEIVDKQPSIRGGGGWTYSVGARSQVLLDGMSILSPKTGEINWNSVPMENLSQIEVIKGASSVLYGSSALNGVINIRTDRPGLEPVTHVSTYVGVYGKYKNPDYNYTNNEFWKPQNNKVMALGRFVGLSGVRQPLYDGLDVSHTRRIGNLDFSMAGNLYTDEGYRQQAYNQRAHVSCNLDYHHQMPSGIYMDYGANLSYLGNQYGDFFAWRSPKEPTKPSPVTNMGREENIFTIDPFFNYTNSHTGISHKVRARYNHMADNLTTPTASANLLDMFMGQEINFENIVDLAGQLIDGDLSAVLPIVSDINNENYSALIEDAIDLIGTMLPELKTDDVMDIAGMVMQLMNYQNGPAQVDHTNNYYIDYQFAKEWENSARITTGATWNHLDNKSHYTGYHVSDNVAAYLQYDQRFFDRLSLSAGMRLEYYRVDDHFKEANMQLGKVTLPFRPVFRAGINYRAGKASFIRASFGQGYRNPSITEKYARKDIGGVGVYPNMELRPESGFNAELGFKQGFAAAHGKFRGSFDVAGFYTEYKDMIEFQFGLFDNVSYQAMTSTQDITNMVSSFLNGDKNVGMGIGAQFVNVSHARIYGVEAETNGEYEFFRDSRLRYSLSYLFSQPEDADWKARNEMEDAYTDPLQMKCTSNNSKYLKYRNKHTFKFSLDYSYKRFSIGANLAWRSKMLAVDYIMLDEREKPEKDLLDYGRELLFGTGYVSEFLTGNEHGYTLEDYWNEHNTDYWTLDFHASCQATKWLEIQLMLNNALNTEYSSRPMALAAPRTYVVKCNFTF